MTTPQNRRFSPPDQKRFPPPPPDVRRQKPPSPPPQALQRNFSNDRDDRRETDRQGSYEEEDKEGLGFRIEITKLDDQGGNDTVSDSYSSSDEEEVCTSLVVCIGKTFKKFLFV